MARQYVRVEHDEQRLLFELIETRVAEYTFLARMFAIKNGAGVGMAGGRFFKEEGVKRGVPDIFLPYPSCGFHGLFIEMKSRRGRVTADQRGYHDYLTSIGYKVVVSRDGHQAFNEVLNYIDCRCRDE